MDLDGVRIADARVVLGGVAPTPWREAGVEQTLRGADLNEDLAVRASAEALLDASPLTHNGYKVRLARALVKRALLELHQALRGGA